MKIPLGNVVLMLIREHPGRTRPEIAKEAASWGLVGSLSLEHPSAALSLIGERLDFTATLSDRAEKSVNDACALELAVEGSAGELRITPAGQAWLRNNSGL